MGSRLPPHLVGDGVEGGRAHDQQVGFGASTPRGSGAQRGVRGATGLQEAGRWDDVAELLARAARGVEAAG